MPEVPRAPKPAPALPNTTPQLRGEVAALGHLDPVELEPRLHLPELGSEVGGDAARVLPGFQERALHHQHTALAVGLEVAAGLRAAPRRRRPSLRNQHPARGARLRRV